MRSLLVLISLLLVTIPFTNAQDLGWHTYVKNATDVPLILDSYDFVVLGGGTTGCPLAATLSHYAKVLLLERGGLANNDPLVMNMKGFFPNLQIDTPTSTAQSFISEDGVPNHRARVLGGGSVINAGFLSKPDLKFIIDSHWNLFDVDHAFQWVVDKVGHFPSLELFQNTTKSALLEAGVIPYNNETYEHLIGTKVGGTLFDKDGHRHTAADLLSSANFDNLDIVTWASVQKILFDESSNCKANGVIFNDLNGVSHTIMLKDERSEVIVSTGAIGSPQLLMLSGIGPAQHLAQFNITTILDNPAVGDHMADNPTNAFWVLTNKEVEVSLIEVVGITPFGSFIEVSSGTAQVVLELLRSSPTYASKIESNSKINNVNAQVLLAQIIKAIFLTSPEYQAQAAWSGNILQKIVGPRSYGNLTLASSDINDNPKVRFGYFSNPKDLDICEKGVRTVLKAINAPSLLSLQYTNATVPDELRLIKDTVESTWPQRDFSNYLQDCINIRKWCKDTVQTIWHYHGGCLQGSVVDYDYRVKGIKGLRVIDGSTFSRSPGTNPQATLMMLGRYMGVKILRERFEFDLNNT